MTEPHIEPHIERMAEEPQQLEERTNRLMNFMNSDDFEGLDDINQELLTSQYHAMSVYTSILHSRVRLAQPVPAGAEGADRLHKISQYDKIHQLFSTYDEKNGGSGDVVDELVDLVRELLV